METLHLSPQEFYELDAWDKIILKYYSMVKGYFEYKEMQKIERNNKVKNPNTMNLPKMNTGGRGRNGI